MSIITANRNFLSSLGITDSSSFFSSFGDLATFETYCDSIGYDYDINEDDELILIDPDGKSISTGVILETTATPTITYDDTTYTVSVTGNGTVTAYVDGIETQMPYTFAQGSEDVTYVVTAIAQEPNKLSSLVASENCLVPAAAPVGTPNYLRLYGFDDDSVISIQAKKRGTWDITSFSYSKDAEHWTDITITAGQTSTIPVTTEDTVYFKAIATKFSGIRIFTGEFDPDDDWIIPYTGFSIGGNIMSLLYGDNFENQTSFPSGSTGTFGGLFSVPEGWYGELTPINDVSQLELPATTLVENCYSGMLSSHTGFTTAPILPAEILVDNCYENLFFACSDLNNITMLATDISATDCLKNWTHVVSPTGTFTKAASMTSLPTGESGIPSGWTVADYQG